MDSDGQIRSITKDTISGSELLFRRWNPLAVG